MFDTSKYKLTTNGLEINGGDYLQKHIEQFPTYDDLREEHTKHFKVKETMRKLGL